MREGGEGKWWQMAGLATLSIIAGPALQKRAAGWDPTRTWAGSELFGSSSNVCMPISKCLIVSEGFHALSTSRSERHILPEG